MVENFGIWHRQPIPRMGLQKLCGNTMTSQQQHNFTIYDRRLVLEETSYPNKLDLTPAFIFARAVFFTRTLCSKGAVTHWCSDIRLKKKKEGLSSDFPMFIPGLTASMASSPATTLAPETPKPKGPPSIKSSSAASSSSMGPPPCQRQRDDNKNRILHFSGGGWAGGQGGKLSKTLFFMGKLHDNKILKVKILLSRNFVVMAQAPILFQLLLRRASPRRATREKQVQTDIDTILCGAEYRRAQRSEEEKQMHDAILTMIFKAVHEDSILGLHFEMDSTGSKDRMGCEIPRFIDQQCGPATRPGYESTTGS